jgi:hypothetical protein
MEVKEKKVFVVHAVSGLGDCMTEEVIGVFLSQRTLNEFMISTYAAERERVGKNIRLRMWHHHGCHCKYPDDPTAKFGYDQRMFAKCVRYHGARRFRTKVHNADTEDRGHWQR